MAEINPTPVFKVILTREEYSVIRGLLQNPPSYYKEDAVLSALCEDLFNAFQNAWIN